MCSFDSVLLMGTFSTNIARYENHDTDTGTMRVCSSMLFYHKERYINSHHNRDTELFSHCKGIPVSFFVVKQSLFL